MSEDRAVTGGDSPPESDRLMPAAFSQASNADAKTNSVNPTVPSAAEDRISAEKSGSGPTNVKNKVPRRRKRTASTGFAPSDIPDGRAKYDWRTRYTDDVAQKSIRAEQRFLFALLYGIPVLMFLIWSKCVWGDLGLGPARYSLLSRYAYAWLGGMLGGTLFDLKWLYHSVAKGLWHQDRSLWRFFTPHISGALAFAFVLLISSNLLRIFDPTTFTSSVSVIAVSFLVGYFSDSAIAKLTEIAETLFGTTRKSKE